MVCLSVCSDVPQSALETIVPKTLDAHVRVVGGQHRGQVSGCLVLPTGTQPPPPPRPPTHTYHFTTPCHQAYVAGDFVRAKPTHWPSIFHRTLSAGWMEFLFYIKLSRKENRRLRSRFFFSCSIIFCELIFKLEKALKTPF